MFESFDKSDPGRTLSFTYAGKSISAKPGMSVAAALLTHGVIAFRQTPVSGAARGPFCMMGACYDCLVLIDGVTVQACLTPVHEGLVVERVPINSEDA